MRSAASPLLFRVLGEPSIEGASGLPEAGPGGTGGPRRPRTRRHLPEGSGDRGPGRLRPEAVVLARLWRRWWPYVRYTVGLGLAALIVYVLAGRSGELNNAASYLEGVNYVWLALAAVLEGLAILSFAGLQRRLLRCGGDYLGLGTLTAITLAGNSMNNSLPAGSAFASVYAFRQYRRKGADDTLAAWTVVAVGLAAGAALAVFVSVGLIISGAEGGLDLVGGTLLILVSGIAVAVVVGVVMWRKKLLVPLFGWTVRQAERFVPRLRGDPEQVARRIVDRLRAVRPRRRDITASLLWAAGNWLFDCSCLAVSFVAVGAEIPWRGLLLAYGAGQLAANLPITPGGLGVVEGSMTIAMVAYGGAEASTVAAVLLYRIVNFWASIPVGWAAWALLALQERRGAVVPEEEAVA